MREIVEWLGVGLYFLVLILFAFWFVSFLPERETVLGVLSDVLSELSPLKTIGILCIVVFVLTLISELLRRMSGTDSSPPD